VHKTIETKIFKLCSEFHSGDLEMYKRYYIF